MSTSFTFRPNDPTPTLHYTKTDSSGDLVFEQTYMFKYMYGFVEGDDIGGQILVPLETEYLPPEVMEYLREQENQYGFRIAPESRVEGEDVQYS